MSKCLNISIGNLNCDCHKRLKVHFENMKKAESDTYLGNDIHFSGSLTQTIEQRIAKGYGIVSEISAFLRDIPFGPCRVKIGLILKEARFLNAILYASESRYGVTQGDIARLEVLDQFLLKRILFNVHSKTSSTFLYLETGTLKIRYIIASRRITYLQNILKRDQDDLVRQYYMAQKEKNFQ